MISRLNGQLAELDLAEAVIDCAGVGYAVTIPMSTYDCLPAEGNPATLHIHTSVREDAIQLYGFATAEERRLFRLLLGISGIGPQLALKVLSAMPVAAFCEAVAAQDIKALCRISGVGKRVAERLSIELRDRIDAIAPAAALSGAQQQQTSLPTEGKDAIAALETLGFKHEMARNAVQKVCEQQPASEQSAENIIRKALQILNS